MGAAIELTTGEWRQINDARANGDKWNAIADRFAMNANTLRRKASERRRPRGQVITPKPTAWNERPVVIPTFADDMPAILEAVIGLRKLGRPAVVKLGSDYHLGDEDVRAIACNIFVEDELQPDLAIDYGDVADLPTLSNFEQARGISKTSALMQIYPAYTQFIDARCEASPNTIRIHIPGNHDDRVDRKTNEAWFFDEEIQRAWAALIRSNGRVLWGGWMQELDVYDLNVRHGERTNKHAAMSTIDNDLAYAQSVIFGHTHRYGVWVRTQLRHGQRKVLQSVNVGFAGKNPPAYRAKKSKGSDWVHACAYAHIWTDQEIVDIKPVLFHETRRGGMVCAVGSKIIEVDRYGRRIA